MGLRQRLSVTSAAVLATVFGAGAMAAPAMAGTHPATARPAAAATGTRIDYEYEGNSGCANANWHYCLYYHQNLGGAYWGTNQQTFGSVHSRV